MIEMDDRLIDRFQIVRKIAVFKLSQPADFYQLKGQYNGILKCNQQLPILCLQKQDYPPVHSAHFEKCKDKPARKLAAFSLEMSDAFVENQNVAVPIFFLTITSLSMCRQQLQSLEYSQARSSVYQVPVQSPQEKNATGRGDGHIERVVNAGHIHQYLFLCLNLFQVSQKKGGKAGSFRQKPRH